MSQKGIVKKWGNSAAIRLPAPTLQAANLNLDDEVIISVNSNGDIMLSPLRKYNRLKEVISILGGDEITKDLDKKNLVESILTFAKKIKDESLIKECQSELSFHKDERTDYTTDCQ
ncbi:antitoxin MazE [Pectobacterium atrosepticum ICMP 1526]|uniref:AbrB/MazE/SpoVT family DNA-binding domain-containing protein n=1 Tax=Pectobacterium atrosepticum TaxID=29471 RepID=UPI00065CE6B4|nr:AbrB/MazE/SpoVT family DNA-binding domain-containing protein [Pectobacterium atrosepticum]KMK87252.1 antitoxin MazE [Pectobacterium atrosepticum ICMP 1526]